jgi:hypothetical protein
MYGHKGAGGKGPLLGTYFAEHAWNPVDGAQHDDAEGQEEKVEHPQIELPADFQARVAVEKIPGFGTEIAANFG